ncbi:Cytochrome P [Parasponia andersonii]|uniref:Cytochrome P n=1 Tax=Parasponia andersonii TaxID=3476 RepID=A0A2P5D924_PARAD|nr:Cytochrome P [Parasponia andersonii]
MEYYLVPTTALSLSIALESSMATNQAESKTLNLFSDAVAPRVLPFIHRTVANYGENSFVWVGPIARVNIMNTEYLREIFTKIVVFQKPEANPFIKTLITGLVMHNGEKWAKHRRILSATFNLEKLRVF